MVLEVVLCALCSPVLNAASRLLTLFREVKQQLTITFELQPCEHNFSISLTWWFLSPSLSGSMVQLTEFGSCDLVPLPMLLQRLGFFLHLYACALFFCTKELFVCLLSASPQEISCDGKRWGSFLSVEMLQGADNRDAWAHKPQQLRRRCHLALSVGGGWAAGRVNHFLEWSGAIGQGNCSLENPRLLLTDEVFTEAGHCCLVLLNPGPWKLWINFYHRGLLMGQLGQHFSGSEEGL